MLLVALLALVAVGCGGGDDEASTSTDVNQLLEDTFKGGKDVKSGKLDLKLDFEPEGGSGQPFSVRLTGPFQSQGEGKLPKFSLAATLEGGGQSFQAGVTSTGDKGFVNFQGTDYAVSDQLFKQFTAAYEEAQKKAKENQQGDDKTTLATLGIDPRRWLTDAKNAGEAKVGDTDTIKITGGVDVSRLLDDVNTALDKARGLGVQGSADLPEKLTEAQKRQVAEAIKDLSVEIYTGKEDTILRRMLIQLAVKLPEGASSQAGTQAGKLALDFSILDLNEDQEVEAPSNPKPFEELANQLGGLGLGGLGGSGGSGSGSGGSGGSGGGSGGSDSGGGASAEDLQKYSDCIEAAGSDTEKVGKCADLLAP